MASEDGGHDNDAGGEPAALGNAANAFVHLSNLCDYLAATQVIHGGSSIEYALENLGVDKPQLKKDWDDTLHQVAGMLLAGVEQFADAAVVVQNTANGLTRADS